MDKQEPIGEGALALHAVVNAVAPGEWQEVREEREIPEQVRAESHFWCDQVLLPDANPHDAPGARRALHRAREGTFDLIRHAYTAKGLDLTLFEGRNFLLLRVAQGSLDLLALPEADRAAAIARAAAALFQQPLEFGNCATVGEGATFCTDARMDPRLSTTWAQRAEAGIHGGEVWFVAYKRIPQLVGFLNPVQWFEDGRTVVRTAARRGGQRSR